jgi:hypothetical protein
MSSQVQGSVNVQSKPGAVVGTPSIDVPQSITEGDIITLNVSIPTYGQVIIKRITISVPIPQPGSSQPYTRIFVYEPPGGLYTNPSGNTTLTLTLPFGLPIDVQTRYAFQNKQLQNLWLSVDVEYDDGTGNMTTVSANSLPLSITVKPACYVSQIFMDVVNAALAGGICAAVNVAIMVGLQALLFAPKVATAVAMERIKAMQAPPSVPVFTNMPGSGTAMVSASYVKALLKATDETISDILNSIFSHFGIQYASYGPMYLSFEEDVLQAQDRNLYSTLSNMALEFASQTQNQNGYAQFFANLDSYSKWYIRKKVYELLVPEDLRGYYDFNAEMPGPAKQFADYVGQSVINELNADLDVQAQAIANALSTNMDLHAAFMQYVSPNLPPVAYNALPSQVNVQYIWRSAYTQTMQSFGITVSNVPSTPGSVMQTVEQNLNPTVMEENMGASGTQSTTGPLYTIETQDYTVEVIGEGTVETTPSGQVQVTPQIPTTPQQAVSQIEDVGIAVDLEPELENQILNSINKIFNSVPGSVKGIVGSALSEVLDRNTPLWNYFAELLTDQTDQEAVANLISLFSRRLYRFFVHIYSAGYYGEQWDAIYNQLQSIGWTASPPAPSDLNNAYNNFVNAYNKYIGDINAFLSTIPNAPQVSTSDFSSLADTSATSIDIAKAIANDGQDIADFITNLDSYVTTLNEDLRAVNVAYQQLMNVVNKYVSQGVSQAQALQNAMQQVSQDFNNVQPPGVTAKSTSFWDGLFNTLKDPLGWAMLAIPCFAAATQAGSLSTMNVTVAEFLSKYSRVFNLSNYVTSEYGIAVYSTYSVINKLKVDIPIEWFIYYSNAFPYVKGINKLYNIIFGNSSTTYYYIGTIGSYLNYFFGTLNQAAINTFGFGPISGTLAYPYEAIKLLIQQASTLAPAIECIMPVRLTVVANGQDVAYLYAGVPITSDVMQASLTGQLAPETAKISLSIGGIGIPNSQAQSQQQMSGLVATSATSSSTPSANAVIYGAGLTANVNNTTVMILKSAWQTVSGSGTASIGMTDIHTNINKVAFTNYTPNVGYQLSIPVSTTGTGVIANQNTSVGTWLHVEGYMVTLPQTGTVTPVKVLDVVMPMALYSVSGYISTTGTSSTVATGLVAMSSSGTTQTNQLNMNVGVAPSSTTVYVVIDPIQSIVNFYDTSGNPLALSVNVSLNGSVALDPSSCTNLGGYMVGSNCVITGSATSNSQVAVNPYAVLPSGVSWSGCVSNPLSDGSYPISQLTNLEACADPGTGTVTIQLPNGGYDGTIGGTIYAVNYTCQNPTSLVLPNGTTASACPVIGFSTYVYGVPPESQGTYAYVKTVEINVPGLQNYASTGAQLYAVINDNAGNSVTIEVPYVTPSTLNIVCQQVGGTNTIAVESINTMVSGGNLVVETVITNNTQTPLPVSFTLSAGIGQQPCDVTNNCNYGSRADNATTPCNTQTTLSPGNSYSVVLTVPLTSISGACNVPLSGLTSISATLGITVSGNAIGTCTAQASTPPCQSYIGAQPAYIPAPPYLCPIAWQHPTCYVVSQSSTTNNGIPVLLPGQNASIQCIVPQVKFPIPVHLYAVPVSYSEVESIWSNYDAMNQYFLSRMYGVNAAQTLPNGFGSNVPFEVSFKASTVPGTHTVVVGFIIVPIMPTGGTVAMQGTPSQAYLIDATTATYQVQSSTTNSGTNIQVGGYTPSGTPSSSNNVECPASNQLSVSPTNINITAPQGGTADFKFSIINGSPYTISVSCSYQDPFTQQVVSLGTLTALPGGSAQFEASIAVPSTAQTGTYNIPVACNYASTDTGTTCGTAPSPAVTLGVIQPQQTTPPSGQQSITGYAQGLTITCSGLSSGIAVCPGGIVTVNCNVTNALQYPVQLMAVVYDASGAPIASLQQPYTAPPGPSTFSLQFTAPNTVGTFMYNFLVMPSSTTPPTSLQICGSLNPTQYYLCQSFDVAVTNATCAYPTQQAPAPTPSVSINLTQVMSSVTELAVVAAMFAMIASLIRSLRA